MLRKRRLIADCPHSLAHPVAVSSLRIVDVAKGAKLIESAADRAFAVGEMRHDVGDSHFPLWRLGKQVAEDRLGKAVHLLIEQSTRYLGVLLARFELVKNWHGMNEEMAPAV